MQQFRVGRGVIGEVCLVMDRRHWRRYVTRRCTVFDEPVTRTRSTVIFRSGRWLLRVSVRDVEIHNGHRWVAMS